MLQVLKGEYRQRIKEDQALQLKIAQAFSKKNIVTVQRWNAKQSPILTSKTVLDILREHIGLTEDVELTEEKRGVVEKAA